MSNTENSKKTLNFNVLTFLDILKKDKRKLYIYCGVAAVLGGVIAFTTPKTYESTVILAPEESGAGFSGSLSSLVSMVGMIVAFITSMFVISFLMSYIKKHDFKVFGYYRIVLGILVLAYYFLFAIK